MSKKRPAAKQAAPRKRPARKTAAKTAVAEAAPGVALVPQPHGGALLTGGKPGNPGNPHAIGRPPSALRARLTGSFWDRVAVLEAIADGAPMQRVKVPLDELLVHAECPKCQGTLKAKPSDDPVELTLLASATPRDRLSAIDLLGKYGPGAVREMSADAVREKLVQTLDAIRAEVDADTAARILARIKPFWS